MKMKPLLRLMMLCVFTGTLFPAHSQDKKGLLWRISGNGLAKPSYLYGTIHLTDKRVFNFGDSLYAALESSAGYAMELDPDSMMMHFINDESNDTYSPLLKDVVDPKLFASSKKKLEQTFHKKPETISVKDIKSYFNDWLNLLSENSRMQTIMDAYLFDISKKQGKWVGGIEDMADQFGMNEDEFSKEEVEEGLKEIVNGSVERKKYFEAMVKLYSENNIDNIQAFFSSKGKESESMIRRNKKMAMRMDSLANIRNTFFAVGCAHLMGDSGVINELVRKGYTLTPVIPSKNIHATEYKFREVEIPWKKIVSSTGLYTVDMPGEPQKTMFDVENLDLKMYADITTNLFYLTMGALGKEITNYDSIMRAMVKNMDKRAKISDIKEIEQDGISGREFLATADKITYRFRLFFKSQAIYLAGVGSIGKTFPDIPDAARFFSSFKMNSQVIVPKDKSETIDTDESGMTIQFPTKPSLKYENAEEGDVRTAHYSALDMKNDVYYQCLVQKINKGMFLSSDSAVFEQYRQNVITNTKMQVKNFTFNNFQGYPSITAEFDYAERGTEYHNRVLMIHRGNLIYTIIGTISASKKNEPQFTNFFKSFSFKKVKEMNWSMQTSPDGSFNAWVSSPIELYKPRESTTVLDAPHFLAYDSLSAVTFFVKTVPYSKYFWAESDTALLREEANKMTGYLDSIRSYKFIREKNIVGSEYIIQLRDNHNVKKVRQLIVGDSLVSIFATAPLEYLENKNSVIFFEEFKHKDLGAATTIFKNKTKVLLTALLTKDSAELSQLIPVLESVKFTKADLPALQEALLRKYYDTAYYNRISQQLFELAGSMPDPSSIQFVKQNYSKVSDERIKYSLLYLLAAQQSHAALVVAKELIANGLPQADNGYEFINELDDSLQLAVNLFEPLVVHLNDTMSSPYLVRFIKNLLDSNLITKEQVWAYKNAIYEAAEDNLLSMQNESIELDWYGSYNLISLIERLNHPKSISLLRKYLSQKDKSVQYLAVISLLKINQHVDATVISKFAAENEYRKDLYNELKKMGKLSLMPKQFATQQLISQSEIYQLSIDDEVTPEKIVFLGERTTQVGGVNQKFYLYKIEALNYDGEKESHLAIAGPFKSGSGIVTDSYATGIIWDQQYSLKTVDQQFKKYLKEILATDH